MFVHMGGSWGKAQEPATIKSGGIWYKKAEVYSVIVKYLWQHSHPVKGH